MIYILIITALPCHIIFIDPKNVDSSIQTLRVGSEKGQLYINFLVRQRQEPLFTITTHTCNGALHNTPDLL